MRFQLAKCVKTNMQTLSAKTFPECKLCQAENERFGRNSLSKSEKVSNRTDLKTNFKNLSKNSALSKCENLSKSKLKNKNSKKFSNSSALSHPESLSSRQNSQVERFVENRLCFKWRQKYGL